MALNIIAETAIAISAAVASPMGQQAVGKAIVMAPKVAPRVIQGGQKLVRGARKIATLTPGVKAMVQIAPEAGKLAAGVAPILTIGGLTVTMTACGGDGGGGDGAATAPKVEEPVPGTNPTAPANCTCAILNWDANTDDAIGYNVHVGTSSENYGNPTSVTANTAYVKDLQRGKTYYFAVSAYDGAGNESENSTEVSKTIASAQ
jgi:hypothetical protein